MTQFLAKYRGKVEDNQDPLSLGRVKVSVPSVLGEDLQVWAMPCVPFAGRDVGFFMLPPRDANVWVEFEGGDLDYPIWSGCFWGRDEVPADPAEEKMKVIKTDKVTMTLNDDPNEGGFFLEVGDTPLKMSFNSQGIEISNSNSKVTITSSKITINGNDIEISSGPFNIKISSSKVSINDGALEVT
jgi:uncharacterized protein involved in type VI secretion and phage assembly